LGLLAAGASMSQVTRMRRHLGKLPQFLRQLFQVYFGFMGLMVGGFGILTFCNAAALADGSRLARSVCLLIGAFWFVRLLVQFFVFDVREYITNGWLKAGYHATTLVFIYLTAIYCAAGFSSK
jgi:hypothetical protein